MIFTHPLPSDAILRRRAAKSQRSLGVRRVGIRARYPSPYPLPQGEGACTFPAPCLEPFPHGEGTGKQTITSLSSKGGGKSETSSPLPLREGVGGGGGVADTGSLQHRHNPRNALQRRHECFRRRGRA